MPRPPADAPLLNPGLIYATALRLIGEEGLESLSMRKLATELGVTPRSLYHYVPTKDALLHEVYISVLKELELPDPSQGDWRDNLRDVARSFRELCHRHKNVAPYFLGGHEPVPQDTAIIEVLLNVLLKAGVPPERVFLTCGVMISFLVGFILSELNGTYGPQRLKQRRKVAEKTPGVYPTFLRLIQHPDSTETDSFEVALELLLGGVETYRT